MTEREKLIAMIASGVACPDDRDPFGEYCDSCRYEKSADCSNERLADHLIAHGVTVQGWISVEDRLPEQDVHVLCRYVFGVHVEREFYGVLDYYAYDPHPHFQLEGMGGMHVTHWMPLPEPPKGG